MKSEQNSWKGKPPKIAGEVPESRWQRPTGDIPDLPTERRKRRHSGRGKFGGPAGPVSPYFTVLRGKK